MKLEKCQTCGESRVANRRPWEDVVSKCPRCGGCAGQIRFSESGRPYTVHPHSTMGNKSYSWDPIIAIVCPRCGKLPQ